MMKLKAFKERHSEEEIRGILSESDPQLSDEIDFESFLRVSLFSVYILFHLFFFFFSLFWNKYLNMVLHDLGLYFLLFLRQNGGFAFGLGWIQEGIWEFILMLMCLSMWNFQAYLNVHGRSAEKVGGANNSSSFLKASTTTLLHTISESEKSLYVAHINSYLRDDPFLKNYLPLDPYSNDLFDLAKDGVLLWYLCRGCCALFFIT